MDELELSLGLRKEGYSNVPLLNMRYETHAIKQNLLHLQSRSLDVNKYPSVVVLMDIIIFPLWNLSGQYIGYQQYRPYADKKKRNDPREGRYYTSLHGDKNEKPIGVWGLESYHYRDDVLFICEGIFDACRLHNLGLPAVALLSGSYKHYKNWLTSTGRKIYKVEDDHGSSLGPYEQVVVPNGKNDLGDCDVFEISKAISNTSFGKHWIKFKTTKEPSPFVELDNLEEEMNKTLKMVILKSRPIDSVVAQIVYDNFWELCEDDS